jgi:hypothetical protein
MEDWKGAIQKSFSEVIANARGYKDGEQVDPTDAIQSKNELLSTIQTEGDNGEDNEKHYLDFLKDKNDLVEIYKLIKNKKLTNNKIKEEIKKYLKDPNKLKSFLNMVIKNKKNKSEYKEATSTGSAGGYEGLFSGEEPKKVEAKEATSTSSSGSYETTGAWAKSTSKKDWRGRSKTQIPGGKFVQVKKKCKRFPYCNQGDIKALNIFENKTLNTVIKRISDKYQIHEDIIKDIIKSEMNKVH